MRIWQVAEWLALAVVLLLGAIRVFWPSSPSVTTAMTAPPTLAPDCQNAEQYVRLHRAPHQTMPLEQALQGQLEAAAREQPVGRGVWTSYGTGVSCVVEYEVTIENEPHTLRWEIHAGKVMAADPLTRRLSGR
jgi:hypothetical protein